MKAAGSTVTHVRLTRDLERQVAESVASGRFSDSSEAISEGLRLLFADEEARRMDLESAIRLGLDEVARGAFVSPEIVRAELAQRRAARQE